MKNAAQKFAIHCEFVLPHGNLLKMQWKMREKIRERKIKAEVFAQHLNTLYCGFFIMDAKKP